MFLPRGHRRRDSRFRAGRDGSIDPVIRRSLESSAVGAVKERVRDELGEPAGDLLDRLGGSSEEDEESPDEQ